MLKTDATQSHIADHLEILALAALPDESNESTSEDGCEQIISEYCDDIASSAEMKL